MTKGKIWWAAFEKRRTQLGLPRTRSANERRRSNQKNTAKRKAWYINARARISAGQEFCRRCGRVSVNLVFGHKIPVALGGNFHRTNIVIMCPDCEQRQGDQPITDLPSIAEEEA